MVEKAISKALQSTCRYKISAFGLNRKGEAFCCSTNKQFLESKGGGLHAEAILMRRHGRKIKCIVICRTNNRGDILPIDPCPNCKKMADRMGIVIKSVSEYK